MMKKSLFSLLALSLLSLVGSTYAATSGTDSVALNDPTTVTVTTETSLTSETPITDVSVSNVISQDGVAVAESITTVPVASPDTTSAPVVDAIDLEQQAKMAVMARATTQEMPPEMEGFLGVMVFFPLFMGLLSLLFGIFWLWMLIDAIKYQTEQKALWIVILFFTSGLGAIIYYFLEKKPRDKANKPVEVSEPVTPTSETPVVTPEPVVEAPVTPEVASVNPEPVVEAPVTPEVVSVNPEPVVISEPVVETPAPVADQSSTPTVS